MPMYNEGEVYSFMCRDGQEILGEFVGAEKYGDGIGFIVRIKNHCFAFEAPPINLNLPPQKVMVSGTEGGNFANEMFIYEEHIIYVKPVIRDSDLYNLYLQNIEVVEKQEDEHKEYIS
jgi:hypothetical protein